MLQFEAAVAAWFDDPELGVSGVVLAERSDGSGRTLEVQRSHEADVQDQALAMDTYCVGIDGGRTHYGGIVNWSVSESGVVRLAFDSEAAEAFEADFIEVTIEAEQADTIRSGLHRLLDHG